MSTLSARERMLGRLRAATPAATADASELNARIDAHYDARREAATPAELAQAMQAALSASHALAWCASAEAWPAQLDRKSVV